MKMLILFILLTLTAFLYATDAENEFAALEKRLRDTSLIHNKQIQNLLFKLERCRSKRIRQSLTNRLQVIIDEYDTTARREPDEFRYHYAPESLVSNGNVHILDQMDGVKVKTGVNQFVTGGLIWGPQGSGKSSMLIDLCQKLLKAKPNLRITIIDFKNGFKDLCPVINATPINLDKVSFDLTPPNNISLDNFIYELTPILASSANLIYGLDILNNAAEKALKNREQYIAQSGKETVLSLEDILYELRQIKTSSFRISGYIDAAKTAISLTLGRQNLFSCRQGLSLEWLFNRNTIINARSLTHDLQCKFLTTYLLYWLYSEARDKPDTKELQHLVIIDDANRAIGATNDITAVSPLGNILAVLRSSGVGLIAASQLPASIDPAVVDLSRNIFVVGNINGSRNLAVIEKCMGLTKEETNSIIQFKKRETLVFMSDSPWPRPIHGWVPFVADLPSTPTPSDDYVNQIVPWHPLDQIPQSQPEQILEPETTIDEPKDFGSSADKLIYDCIIYPDDKANVRAKRSSSARAYNASMMQAVQEGYLIASQCGKSIYLIPTKEAYAKFSIVSPYKRSASIEHSFYVNLAAHILKKNSTLKVKAETPIGTKGATIDITTIDKSGTLEAFEITLSTSNLASNAAKMQESAYQTITWLCRDAATASAVKAFFNKTTALPPELLAKFEYTHFSKFTKGKA